MYFFCLHIVYVLQSATSLEEQQDNMTIAYNQGYKYLHVQHFSVAATMRIQTVHKTTADLLSFLRCYRYACQTLWQVLVEKKL